MPLHRLLYIYEDDYHIFHAKQNKKNNKECSYFNILNEIVIVHAP